MWSCDHRVVRPVSAWFGRDETDAHLTRTGQAVVPDGLAVADAVQFLQRVQGGLPVTPGRTDSGRTLDLVAVGARVWWCPRTSS